MPQITLRHIRKSFTVYERPEGRFSVLRGAFQRRKRTVHALDNIGFSIDEGELIGYIGPNGAGKSTTVKVMSGILTPDGGECTISGRVPWRQRVDHVREIGVVFGQRSQLWWDVPVADSFEVLRDIYGRSRATERRQKQLVEALDIGDLLKTPTRQLSLGQRMRCEIVAALLHEPRILFLDEPTIGLDAVSKLAVRAFLLEENRRSGITMILTTHDMADIEALCDRVMVIGHGSLLYDGALGALKETYAPLHRVRARLPLGATPPDRLEGAQRVEAEEGQLTAWFDPRRTPVQDMIASLFARAPVQDVVIEEQDVDEMVANMYREMSL